MGFNLQQYTTNIKKFSKKVQGQLQDVSQNFFKIGKKEKTYESYTKEK